jgi:putative methyltransferase (TIGR04325 family)
MHWRWYILKDKIKRLIGYSSTMWKGDYATWADAQKQCKGYDAAPILAQCKAALLKIQAGEARYERDSMLFNEPNYSWALLTTILKTAIENDFKVHILDFGGSLGSVYYQNKPFLDTIAFKEFTWSVVEQENFVTCGKELAEKGALKFYYTIEECQKERQPNIVLASGVVSHVEQPYYWINKFIALNPLYIILDRVPFLPLNRDVITVQNVFSSIYEGNYPCWFFNEPTFIKAFKPFDVTAEFTPYDDIVWVNGYKNMWKGLIFKKNTEGVSRTKSATS